MHMQKPSTAEFLADIQQTKRKRGEEEKNEIKKRQKEEDVMNKKKRGGKDDSFDVMLRLMIACETMKNGLMVFDSNDNSAGVRKNKARQKEKFCKRKEKRQ